MQQALSIYQQPPPTAFPRTRLEFVARYDLGLTFPHQVVTHRFYFLSASIVSTVIAPREDEWRPPNPRQRGRAARKRPRQLSREIQERELGICAREIPNTPQGIVKISAFMDTVGDFHFVVKLHKYPTAWHLGDFEASEVIATLRTESIKVTESRLDIIRPEQIESEWECVTLMDSLVSSDPGTWETESDESDGGVFH